MRRGKQPVISPEVEALKQFRRNNSDPNRGPTGNSTCPACLSEQRRCPQMDFRPINRKEHEDARQVARDIAETKQYEFSVKLRKKVEMLFVHLKRIRG